MSDPKSELDALLDLPDCPPVLLSGPAGSGKTTLTGAFARNARLRGLTLAITAPTHKALRVLKESLGQGDADPGLLFTTLHSLLRLRLSENEDGSFGVNPGPTPDLSIFDWILVDECSLVGKDLLNALEKARGNQRILYVGDPNQLPPVDSMTGPGEPPVFQRPLRRIVLTQVHRQEETHPIHRLTRTLLAWDPASGRPGAQDLFPDAIDPETNQDPDRGALSDRLFTLRGSVGETARWAARTRTSGENLRILAYTNRRVELYNRILYREEYGERASPFAVEERVLLHETSVLRTPDGELLLLPAGEELVVREIFPERHPDYPEIPAHRLLLSDETGTDYSVLVPNDPVTHQKRIDDLFREIRRKTEEPGSPAERSSLERGLLAKRAWTQKRAFAQIRHGYAMTVFKAQGSTFDSVIVDWQDLNLFRDDRVFVRALYVAATRPRHRLIVAGTGP